MAFTRITEDDLQGKGVIGQPEVPGLSTLEMQQSVEQIVREVAIPGINRLAEELEAATGAAGIGMERPAGMPEEVPAHVQGITAAHIENRENPHGVTAAQVGAYTRQETDAAINKKVVEIGTGDMARAVYAANGEPGVVDAAVHARAADDGVKLYTHTRSGTVHEFTGSGASGRALMTADVQEGDTFTLNGMPVQAFMGAEEAVNMMAGQPYTGRWVTFVTDAETGTLNFKGGGGPVTVEGLSADVIWNGNTIKLQQGAKVLQTVLGRLDILAVYGVQGDNGGTMGQGGLVRSANGYSVAGSVGTIPGVPLMAIAGKSSGYGTFIVGGNSVGVGTTVYTEFPSKTISFQHNGGAFKYCSAACVVLGYLTEDNA